MNSTGFFYDERSFWHSTGLHVATLPVGGWVQPPSGAAHAENPETKRRLKNLLDVSGLSAHLRCMSAAPASETDLLRVHDLCAGRLAMVHEGGYSEAYVPFCGLAVIEQLSGVKTEVADPMLAFIQRQQPRETFNRVQRALIDEYARALGLY